MPDDPELTELRAHPRTSAMRRGVVIAAETGQTVTCVIIDVSLGGAKLQIYAPELPDAELSLIDGEKGTIHRLRVAWRQGPFVGVAFVRTTELPSADPA